ncbi:MAG: hypothetical protein GXC76_02105 [Rhodanobacteraceae bacterium]|jgi:hypothetical protein|nr:hypothetical protein [Rhodanobacteraceae bacterium]
MPKDVVTLFAQEDGKKLIQKHCRGAGLPVADLKRLVEEVVDRGSLQRRAGLWQAFDEVLDQAESGE